MHLRVSLITLLLGFSLAAPAAAAETLGAAAEKAWIFFDLGKTLIDHSPQYTDMRFLPGTADTLAVLKKSGYRLGLLINWPEEEGRNDSEKLDLLKKFMGPQWVDNRPFDWSLFDAVLFPPRNQQYKPHPYLFEQALSLAAPCPALFQGEQEDEVRAAQAVGLAAHQVNYFPAPGRGPTPLLPIDEIERWYRHRVINLFGCSGR